MSDINFTYSIGSGSASTGGYSQGTGASPQGAGKPGASQTPTHAGQQMATQTASQVAPPGAPRVTGQPVPPMQSAQPQIPEDPTLWSFTGVELVSLSDELTLLIDRISGKRLMVRPEVGITLTYCEHFRTLRGHAEHLVTVLPQLGGQVEPVVPVLAHIRDAGLMRSAGEMLSRLTPNAEPVKTAPLNVFVITCDRPEAVERLIDSLEAAPGLDLPKTYWLIDDSRDAENVARNQAVVEACNARGKVPLQYFGLAARDQLIAHLINQLPDHADSVRFLLDRNEWGQLPTYGISRTLALLLSVGERAVVLDDDVLCEAVRSPLPSNGVQFGSINAREAVFYGSRDGLVSNTRKLPDNPITLAARQLGQPLNQGLRSLLHGELSPEALHNSNGAFVRGLKPNSPILMTQCSTWGDPGTGSGHWVASLSPESIGRLLDTPEGFSATVDARSVWLGYTSPTFTRHGVMSQLTGYDATRLLPPFMPALRGEDQLFSFMAAALHPDSLVLNHDWAVTHLPLENRSDRGLRAPIPSTGGLSLLTRWLADNVDVSEGITPATRLGRIAQSVAELTELETEELINFGRVELAKMHAQQLSMYQQQFNHVDGLNSDNWYRYLSRGQQEILEALQREPDLTDILGNTIDDDMSALTQLRRGGKRLAQALRSWPEIWKSASQFEVH